MIATFYNHRIKEEIVKSQKSIFDLYNQKISQIFLNDWPGHGKAVDNYLNNLSEDWEYFMLFDIDCIPLDKYIIPETIEWVKNNVGIFSVAQKASHIPNSIVYASPAFISFSRETYNLLGKPSFLPTSRSDCGAELTYIANEKGIQVKLMYPTKVEVPKWELNDKKMFGYGTNYENRIYHSFESRFNRNNLFINKCNEILNG